jgi:NDP-sugar pyrophosphorylase family protein
VTFIEIEGITTGPASTVKLALPHLNPNLPVIVANSDQYVSHDLSSFLEAVRNSENPGTILTMTATGSKWSYIGRNELGNITEVVEKRPISDEATVGIYAWSSPELLRDSIQYIESEELLVNNEYYVAPSYCYLVLKGLSIGVYSVGDHGDAVHGLGTPEDLSAFLNHAHFEIFKTQVEL